jgi:uncharacterized membrane protein YdjX (TVP38/TMEM64 family)
MQTTTKPVEASPFSSYASRFAKGVLAVALLLVVLWAGRHLGSYVPRFSQWVEGLGYWAPLAFVIGYAVATVAFIPGSLLTLAAGAIFGLLKGSVVVFIGATLGASGAFFVSRYLARAAVEQRIDSQPRFRAIDRAVARQGLKIVFLLRLSPVFPFNLLNYGLGLTQVRFRDYLVGCIGMIPATFLYVYYGKALGSIAALAGGAPVEKDAGYWLILTVGLIATMVVAMLVTRIARRALRQEISDDG